MTPLVCFDLDGCLVDSTLAITRCIRHALERHGLPVPAEARLRAAIGPPLGGTFRALIDEAGMDPAMVGSCLDSYRERYAAHGLAETLVIDGMADTLRALAGGADLVVVTSKPASIARSIVEGVGLDEHFLAVYGPGLDEEVEPKEVTLAGALRDHERPSGDHVWMVGDRHHDIDAGKAHRTRTVGVTWGAGTSAELRAAGADHIVHEPVALIGLVGGAA
jgi:phosphoglycolate phosphatase